MTRQKIYETKKVANQSPVSIVKSKTYSCHGDANMLLS